MKLKGLLIDPFQRKVHRVNVENNINDWYRFLDCDTVTGVYPPQPPETDIFVDDNGLLREPIYPRFRLVTYGEELAGYGLVLSHRGPESISTRLTPGELMPLLQWEDWEKRLPPEPYFEQLSRIYLDTHEGSFGLGGKTSLHICSICKLPYQGWGNNAQPVNAGRCCDRCNQEVVMPRRVGKH
jgi:hypothetical protein